MQTFFTLWLILIGILGSNFILAGILNFSETKFEYQLKLSIASFQFFVPNIKTIITV